MTGDRLFPSYGLSLLLESLPNAESLQKSILDLISRAIETENAHHLRAIEALIDRTEEGLEAQIASRTDSLDAFFENLRDREDAPRPQKIVEELTSLMGVPIRLNNDQLRTLGEDPGDVKDDIKEMVTANLTSNFAARVIAAAQNRTVEPLGESYDLSYSSWKGHL